MSVLLVVFWVCVAGSVVATGLVLVLCRAAALGDRGPRPPAPGEDEAYGWPEQARDRMKGA